MPRDFLQKDAVFLARDLAGAVHKVYQRLNLAGKNAEVDRLRRQIFRLAGELEKARETSLPLQVQHHLRNAQGLIHECVPLLSLCLQHHLLSRELYDLWTAKLEELKGLVEEWFQGAP